MNSPSKKFRLHSEDAPEIFLLGILSAESDLKLVWLINQQLGINLSRSEPFRFFHKKIPTIQEFPSYLDSKPPSQARLIRNLSAESFKIPEYKEFDFLLVTHKPSDVWIPSLQKIEEIRAVFKLDALPLNGMMQA